MVLETALLAFKRVDYSEGTTSIIKELVSLAPLSTVRSKVIARLQGLILAAAGKVAVALDQAQEWSQILGLLELDMHFSQCETRTSSLFVGDLIWIYSMIAGLGSVEESEIIWRAIHSFSISLRSLTGGGEAHSTAVSQTKAAWMILQELQQTDIVEQLQDGYVPQVAIAMHKFISRLTQMSVAFSPSQGELFGDHIWHELIMILRVTQMRVFTGLLGALRKRFSPHCLLVVSSNTDRSWCYRNFP